jgi:hypothetical protein
MMFATPRFLLPLRDEERRSRLFTALCSAVFFHRSITGRAFLGMQLTARRDARVHVQMTATECSQNKFFLLNALLLLRCLGPVTGVE